MHITHHMSKLLFVKFPTSFVCQACPGGVLAKYACLGGLTVAVQDSGHAPCFKVPLPGLPCFSLPCPVSFCPALSLPCFPALTLPCLSLPCLSLSCLSLPWLSLPCLSCPALSLPALSLLPCSVSPCPVSPCPVSPVLPALPCLVLLGFALCTVSLLQGLTGPSDSD